MSESESTRVRLTGDEGILFREYASEQNTTRSRILRKVIRELVTAQPDLLPEEITAFRDATRQLAGAATNLNQLAHAVNAGRISGPLVQGKTFETLQREVHALQQSLQRYVNVSKTRWTPNE